MKKILKSAMAVLLVLTMLAGLSTAMAASEKKHLDYGSYVLLGDSVASGWSDIEERDTSFVRVEGSYGAYLADDLGVEYHPKACIGFRTHEMRYVFEDDYVGDDFMFYPIDKERVDLEIPSIRKAVSEAGLVTLSVGGNDWGSYLGWNVYVEMDKFQEVNEEFFTKAREYLESNGTATDTVTALIDIASLAGCLPELVQILPGALKKGFENFVANWNYVIEDIYALNPDVTLVVVGMFDTSLQDESMSAMALTNESTPEARAAKLSIGQLIVDYANKPMRENAEKYGYIFIDPIGTLCEKQHPSAAGHRHIADLILAALPDAEFPYTDVSLASDDYVAVEYMWRNDIIDGITETQFAPDEAITKGAIENAFAVLAGSDAVSTDESDATRLDIIKAVIGAEGSFTAKLKALGYAISLFVNGGKFNFTAGVTRAEAAEMIYGYITL